MKKLLLVVWMMMAAGMAAHADEIAVSKKTPAQAASEPLSGAGKYESDQWAYQYGEQTGWKSKHVYRGGSLTFAGQAVQPHDRQTCILTPWGWLRWTNTSKSEVGCLWMPLPAGEVPAADLRLPDPTKEPKAFARSQQPPAPLAPADVNERLQDANTAKQQAIEEELRRRQAR